MSDDLWLNPFVDAAAPRPAPDEPLVGQRFGANWTPDDAERSRARLDGYLHQVIAARVVPAVDLADRPEECREHEAAIARIVRGV